MARIYVTRISSTEGDWEGIYFDGRLELEGHSVSILDLLQRLQYHTVVGVITHEIDFESLNLSRCPQYLSELERIIENA